MEKQNKESIEDIIVNYINDITEEVYISDGKYSSWAINIPIPREEFDKYFRPAFTYMEAPYFFADGSPTHWVVNRVKLAEIIVSTDNILKQEIIENIKITNG